MNRKMFILTAGVLALGYFLSRMLVFPDPHQQPKPMHEYMILTDSEVAELKNAASYGDTDAMIRLATHYGIGLSNDEMAFYYTWMAAKQKNPSSLRSWETLKGANPKLANEIEGKYPE